MEFKRYTKRLYYDFPDLAEIEATIVAVGEDYIELDGTIAYPEGGGQEADFGTITAKTGETIHFNWAKKMFSHSTPDYPDVKLGGVIFHMIEEADRPQLSAFKAGAQVHLKIDWERRARLSLSHTACHVMVLGVEAVRPDLTQSIIGCHVKSDASRIDYATADRFTPEQITEIEVVANDWINKDLPIQLAADDAHPDIRFWRCADVNMPCGGTHITQTGKINQLSLKRKNPGCGKERLICRFDHADFS